MDFGVFDWTNPIGEFISVGILTGLLVLVRYFKRTRPGVIHLANLIEWFAIFFIPVALAIAAIEELNISRLWMHFPILVSSALFIGVGVRNAYHHEDGWSQPYRDTFIVLTLSIVLLEIFLTMVLWTAPQTLIFPWLNNTSL